MLDPLGLHVPPDPPPLTRLRARLTRRRDVPGGWGLGVCPCGGRHRVVWQAGFHVDCPLTLTRYPIGAS